LSGDNAGTNPEGDEGPSRNIYAKPDLFQTPPLENTSFMGGNANNYIDDSQRGGNRFDMTNLTRETHQVEPDYQEQEVPPSPFKSRSLFGDSDSGDGEEEEEDYNNYDNNDDDKSEATSRPW
jgi:hypothetical protein